MKKQFRPAIVSFLLLTLITGVIYPAVITFIATTVFANEAAGRADLIGQPFSDAKYFWSRPSATSPTPYAADAGAGSNLSASNPALADAMQQRAAALHAADPTDDRPIPIDLLTASASGLDPHISVEAAEYQIARVARARNVDPQTVRALVEACTEGRTFGVLGEPRVNVLKLNLLLDSSEGH